MGKGGLLTLRESPNPNICKYLQTLAQLDTDLLKFTSSNTGGPCGDVAQGSPLMDRIWLFPGLKNTKCLKIQTCSMLIIRVSRQRGDAASASKLLHLSKAVCGTTNVIYAMYIEHL